MHEEPAIAHPNTFDQYGYEYTELERPIDRGS